MFTKPSPHPDEDQQNNFHDSTSLFFEQNIRLLFKNWRFLVTLTFLLGISILGTLWHITTLQSQIVRSTTLNNALLYSQAIAEFRTIYTSEVVNTAKKYGLEITHDYAGKENAIPLPATLSLLLGKKIGEHTSGAQVHLYSPYPFPWRLQNHSQRDEFSKQAWEFLNQDPKESFFRYEILDERPVLRYATADLMRDQCIDCHNTHPDSPKTDWKVGDVRGVLEIILPIDASVAQAKENLTGTFIILGIFTCLGVVGIGMVVGKLRQSAETLQMRVDERTQALETANLELGNQTIELSKAKDMAVMADSSKSDFLARMSHEIRTPMNAIIGLSNLLLKSELNPRQKDYQHKVLESSRHLLSIINDILDFSKIEAGKMDLESVDFLLYHVIEQSANMFRTKAAEKQIELFYLTEPDVPQSLQGDPLRISQIMINLLSNAVKFTDEGEVVVRVQLNKDPESSPSSSLVNLLVTVKDSGAGIGINKLETLFQPFTQADGSISRKFGGTGLGLSICQRLVTQMGGKIWAESVHGQGTTFFFTLNLPQGSRESPVLLSAPPDIRGLKVLLVEDNDTAQLLIEEMLHSLGFKVTVASSGQQALLELEQALNDKAFELVITDYQMPEMDGMELSTRIRSHDKLTELNLNPKIILVTMYDRDELIQQTQVDGLFDGYLLKPINSSELFNVIMQSFGKDDALVPRISRHSDTDKKPGLKGIEGAKLLLVEDNYINQEVAIAILKEAGLQVDIAADGKQAVDLIMEDLATGALSYEAVLMDVQMPVWDGYMATKVIRKDSSLDQLPIIAMTAHALKGDKEKCLAAGMNDYITKPIDERELFATLTKWLPAKSRTPIPPASDIIDRWQNIPANIPGIDLEAGLVRIKGDSSLFKRMLCNFLERYATADEELKQYLQQGEIVEAKALVHTLKGVSGNLCANALFKESKRLDEFLQRHGFAQAEKRIDTFCQALSSLVTGLRGLNLINDSPISTGEQGPADLVLVSQLIKQLSAHLKQSNSRASHSMDELKAIPGLSRFKQQLSDLEKAIYAFEFDIALAVLTEIAKSLEINLEEDL